MKNGFQGTLSIAVCSSLSRHKTLCLVCRTLPVFRALTCTQHSCCIRNPNLKAASPPRLQNPAGIPYPLQCLMSPPCREHLCLETSTPKSPTAPCRGTTALFYMKNSCEARKTPSKAQGCKEKTPNQGDHMDVSPRPAACTAKAFVLMTRHQAAKALSGGSWLWRGRSFAPAPATPQISPFPAQRPSAL